MVWDIHWDDEATSGDWILSEEGDLSASDALGAAIIMCLFTNRPRPIRRGVLDEEEALAKRRTAYWHGDTFDVVSYQYEGILGSYLWTLRRQYITPQLLMLARHYAAEALQVLVDQRLVRGFLINVEADQERGWIKMQVTALQEWDRDFFFTYPLF